MNQLHDVVRGHDFDGIQEFDNRLPNWWLWTFYLACIFSVGYWIHYHVLGTGALPPAELARSIQEEGKRALQMTPEALAALAADADAVGRGKDVFVTQCVACHRQDGGGVPALGPNLTDKFWIHGGRPDQIYHTVVNGVPGKAMVPWGPALGATKCQEVTAYVLTLRNTNVGNGKPPEGHPED
jgi:cytochrome c oxidase cbb3-type subunit 3